MTILNIVELSQVLCVQFISSLVWKLQMTSATDIVNFLCLPMGSWKEIGVLALNQINNSYYI